MTLEPPTLKHHHAVTSLVPRSEDDLHYQVAYAMLVERWGVTGTRRNHGAVLLLRALCSRPSFRAGKRVAWSTPKIARVIGRDARTVTTIVRKWRELPELITVRTVRPGELRWNGRVARFKHLDWQLGPALRDRLTTALQRAAVRSGPNGSQTPSPTDVTPPDLALEPADEINLKSELSASPNQLNFKVPDLGKFPSPTQPAAQTQPAKHPPSATAVPRADMNRVPFARSGGDPGHRPHRNELRPPRKALVRQPSTELDVNRLAHPVHMLAGIIRLVLGRDHRQLHADEFYLVDGALRCLAGQWPSDAIPELVEQVLAMALRDHARARAESRTDRERPTLAYVFGGPKDAPHLPHRHFLDRVTAIRERKIEADEHQLSEGHARLAKRLFGGSEPSMIQPPPFPGPSHPCSPSLTNPASSRPPVRGPSTGRLTAAEIDAALAVVEANWEQPYRAHAG